MVDGHSLKVYIDITHLSTSMSVTRASVKDSFSSVVFFNCSGKGHIRGRSFQGMIGRNTEEPEFTLAEAWKRSFRSLGCFIHLNPWLVDCGRARGVKSWGRSYLHSTGILQYLNNWRSFFSEYYLHLSPGCGEDAVMPIRPRQFLRS